MGIVGLILLGVGGIIAVVCGIWLLVVAFKTSVWWGLGSIFVPFVSLIFVIVHWNVAKKPFLYSLIGYVLIILGSLLMPESSFQ